MTTTARTPYWFWSDDLIVVDAERQFHQPGKHPQKRHGRRKGGKKFSRLRDIKNWERKNFRDWDENLSENELKSIAGYFLPDLIKIQTAAREKGIGDRFLDSAIAKARIPEDITVFRGMGTSKYKDVPLVGTLFEDKGYASTSLQRTEAEQYLTAFKTDEEDILLEILVPKGSKAMPISMLTSRPDARKFGFSDPIGGEFSELVLPRNSRLEILSDVLKKTKTEIALLNSRTGEIILEPINRTLRNLITILLPEK